VSTNHWGTRRTIVVVTVSVVVALTTAVAWPLSKSPTYNCAIEHSTDSYQIRPRKVIVQPWLGQHHVYGIFVVPLRYRSGRNYSGVLSVQSYKREFSPDQQPEVQQLDDVVVGAEYYLVKGYLSTRVALWFLFTGQFGDLLDPCNWTLEFVKRTRE